MISHPEKVLFPTDGITKGEVAAYYEAIAPFMVPLIKGRPITMERFPSGIGGKGFMQKNVAAGTPEWIERVEVPKKDGVVNYPLVMTERDLLWTANQNCITLHAWTARMPDLYYPDLAVFDLDPSVDDPAVLRAATLGVRDLLVELGLESVVKTSGSKGYHVAVPLDGKAPYDRVIAFTHAVARMLVERAPDHLTLEFLKADRGTRIYMDVGRNAPGATFAAPYTIRPKPGAPISAPCTWEEIERGAIHPQSFTLRTMAARIDAAGDPWSGLAERGQSLDAAIAKVEGMGLALEAPVIRRFGNARGGRRKAE